MYLQPISTIWEGMWSEVSKFSVVQALELLHSSSPSHQYTAIQVSEEPEIFLAIDGDRRPAVLLTSDESGRDMRLKTDLISLSLNARASCFVQEQGVIERKFHMLQCETTDISVIDSFITLIQAFILRIEQDNIIGSNEMMGFFQSLVRLFKVTPSPDMWKERQGLWGELFAMFFLGDVRQWMTYWHTDPTHKFDFSSKKYRVEVKSSLRDRIHHFSHDQLFSVDKEIAIISLLLRSDDAGKSLRELITEARAAISSDPQLVLKLERSIRNAGMNNPTEVGPKFDPEEARRQLAIFWSHSVPRFDQVEPPGVSNTHYQVDLSTVSRVTMEEFTEWHNHW